MRRVYAKQIVHTHQCCAFALPCNLFAMSVALNFRKCFALAALFVCGQPGGDRVRQRCCPRIYDMREIPQNGNKKSTLFRVLDLLGGEAGICLIASTELARNAMRQPGGDRVRQRCCPRIYNMREIPQNGNKKALFSECLICLAEKQGFEL